jgi:CheY-like chemotaxis protein
MMQRLSRPAPPGRKRAMVLYVEDELPNFQIAELRLSSSYELLRAANSRDACRIVRLHGNELYAVLMDIKLIGSEMDGVQLTQAFRGKPGPEAPDYALDLKLEVPILFVTAHGAIYPTEVLLAAGGDAVVSKPVDFVELTRTLTQHYLSRTTR